jgi:hypothetical protein
MKKRPEHRRYRLAARFERAARKLSGQEKRWLLGRLHDLQSGKPDRDFWVLDLESGRWRRL